MSNFPMEKPIQISLAENPEISHETAESVIASLEQLDPYEFGIVVNAISDIARNRTQQFGKERLLERSQEITDKDIDAIHYSLSNIRKGTKALKETRHNLNDEVIRAKQFGASWGEIAIAAKVPRDVAYLRWSGLIEMEESQHP